MLLMQSQTGGETDVMTIFLDLKNYSGLTLIQNTQFRLLIDPSDVEVWGIGSGREVPSNQKTITLDSQTFFVTQGGGNAGIQPSANQPSLFATGNLSNVYRFKITNNGNQEISIGRFTMEIYPSGMDFISLGSGNFALFESFGGHDARKSSFNTQVIGSKTVRFDAQNEIYIPARGSREFSLRVALKNTSGSNRSIAIKILGDETLSKGTLASMKAGGANFVWSDQSGGPHTSTSADWFSGYLFPGLPTDTFVNRQ